MTAFPPYNDRFLMAAQVLSIVAFTFSIGYSAGYTWVTLFLGLASMIMLQVMWCCSFGKCGVITAGVFGTLSGLDCFVTSALIFTRHAEACYGMEECDYTAVGIVAIVAGLLWMAVSVLTFVFACKRMDPFLDDAPRQSGAAVPVAFPLEVSAEAPGTMVPGSSTTTTTQLPDGSKQVETVTVNKDGSRTVETTIEAVTMPP